MNKFNVDQNLIEKENLIERLKNLIHEDTNISNKYNEFKKIQNSWFKIGPVPRSKNGIVWNNFQHHVKNFYDYLHLNRKFKEIDLIHNLKEKEKIIQHSKKLIDLNDKFKASKDFERLKKRWKFELGPSGKENDEKLNSEFFEIEKIILENRKDFDENKESILAENHEKKLKLISEIHDLISTETDSVKLWQKKINDFEKVKKTIENIGPIPRKFKKTFWNEYKNSVRQFYSKKNVFFKKLKKIYTSNIQIQNQLIEEVETILNGEDLEKNRSQIISIQKKWKLVKPLPYKVNEKNWRIFKEKCDIYFKKLSLNKDLHSKKLLEAKTKQNELIEKLDDFNGEEKDLEIVVEEFFKFSKISYENENIFFKKIKKLLMELGTKKSEIENKISDIKSKLMSVDQKNIELKNINNKIDSLKKEVSQQENNLSFFNENSKENKLLKTVHDKIKKNKNELELLKKHKNKLLK